MTRSRTALGIFLAAVLLLPSRSLACSCYLAGTGAHDYREAIMRSGAVFRGTVVEVQQLQSLAVNMVVFDADAAWAGIKSRRVFVFTRNSSDDCGYPFEVGKHYVVWAERNESWSPAQLNTSTCGFTLPLESAGEQLRQLGQPKELKQ